MDSVRRQFARLLAPFKRFSAKCLITWRNTQPIRAQERQTPTRSTPTRTKHCAKPPRHRWKMVKSRKQNDSDTGATAFTLPDPSPDGRASFRAWLLGAGFLFHMHFIYINGITSYDLSFPCTWVCLYVQTVSHHSPLPDERKPFSLFSKLLKKLFCLKFVCM